MMATDAAGVATSTGSRRIAVAGNPNSGKTSIFNKLSGLRQKVGNYPGVTVEKREALLTGAEIVLLDLPGTYSLSARSPDEEIARDVLLGRVKGMKRPDAVLLVIDACNLERNLYLASQILEFGAQDLDQGVDPAADRDAGAGGQNLALGVQQDDARNLGPGMCPGELVGVGPADQHPHGATAAARPELPPFSTTSSVGNRLRR